MQKVYLVLRHNRQQGPFTLTELLALPLLPTDLIWVEGQSTAWSYPAEIRALQPYLQPTGDGQITAPLPSKTEKGEKQLAQKEKKIFVSLPFRPQSKATNAHKGPEDALEQKAEALRQRALAHSSASPAVKKEKIESRLHQPTAEQAATNSNWALPAKKKKKLVTVNSQALLVAALLVVFGAGGWWLLADKEQAPAVSTKVDNEAVTNALPIAQPNEEHTRTVTEVQEPVAAGKVDQRENKPFSTPSQPLKSNEAIPQPQTAEFETEIEAPVKATDTEASVEDVLENEAPAQNRKSIGQAIDGFFEKFKNKSADEKTVPIENGERRSKKRSADSETGATTLDIASQVKLSANKPATSWMLGIKGLQLTLHNQSEVLLQSAIVQIHYFDEEETLIEEKTIQFSNIKTGQKKTLTAPEHRLASFTRQQVVQATGINQ